ELRHRFELGFTELAVTPGAGFRAGGVLPPYTQTQTYTVRNVRSQPVSVSVHADRPWVVLESSGLAGDPSALEFALAAGETRDVCVSIGPAADALPTGTYVAAVEFRNTLPSNLDLGTTSRGVNLAVTRGSYSSLRLEVPDGDPEGVLLPIEATEAFDVC